MDNVVVGHCFFGKSECDKMDSMKTAVVTGSNKGIGYAIVKGLCEKFNGVVYLTARDVTRGKEAVAKLNELGFKPEFHQLDITDKKSIATFAEFMKNKHGGIDVLVNNAAIAYKHDATDPFSEQAEVTVRVNYFALLDVCEALFPLLQPNARVVNLSSSCGHLTKIPSETLRKRFSDPNLTLDQLNALMKEFVQSAAADKNVADGWGSSAYNVSKVGVSALTIIQQRQFDEDPRPGIVVNCVHPGYVDTDMTSHKGHLTIEQGAEAPLFLALLPPDLGSTVPKGQYVWCDKKIVSWTSLELDPTLNMKSLELHIKNVPEEQTVNVLKKLQSILPESVFTVVTGDDGMIFVKEISTGKPEPSTSTSSVCEAESSL